jgi:DNA-binding transcriptional ArsR family regulator
MEQSSVEMEPPAVRNVNEVEVLKALADPTRLAIISALMKSGAHVDESQQAMQAVLDLYREGFFAAFRADKSPADEDPVAEDYTRPLMFMCDLKVSPARAAELRRKLQEIMDSLKDDQTEDPDGVTLNLLIGCYVPVEETGRRRLRAGTARTRTGAAPWCWR